MFKKVFLFITAILAATSTSTGYDSTDSLNGNINATTFLDWFSNAEKCVHGRGLIILDLIPILFLIVQAFLFFKDGKKVKGIFTILALLANLLGVYLLVKYSYPNATQIAGWTPDKLPSDWIAIKDNWVKFTGLHGLMGVLGWLCFVITFFVSERKNTEARRLPGFLNFTKNALAFILTFMLGLSAARLYNFLFFPFQYEISGATFIEMHRPVDLAIRQVGPILFTVILSLEAILATLFFVEKSNKKGWLIIAVIVSLLCDTFIALNYNRPINDLFLSWTPATVPANWTIVRDEWLRYHLYRDIFMIFGFVFILLIYFVQKNRRTT